MIIWPITNWLENYPLLSKAIKTKLTRHNKKDLIKIDAFLATRDDYNTDTEEFYNYDFGLVGEPKELDNTDSTLVEYQDGTKITYYEIDLENEDDKTNDIYLASIYYKSIAWLTWCVFCLFVLLWLCLI